MRKGTQKGIAWGSVALVGAAVLAADQASKYLVHTYLPYMNHEAQWYPYKGIGVFDNVLGIEFSLVHAINHGAAWGILADFQVPLLAFRLFFIMGLLFYLLFYNTNWIRMISLTLVIAGACGNCLDYFLYGHVVDMIHFVFWGYDYPVFNLADISIFSGVSLFALSSWLQKRGWFSCAP